jgi:glutamate carboxypeptidase
MDPILAYAREKLPEIVRFIRTLVECESPSDDPAAVRRFVELVADTVAGEGRTKVLAGGRYGPHLRIEFARRRAARAGNRKQLLVLGHSDTVYPMGTLASMPWREAEGRLRGPGVLDMKGGIAFFLFATRALRELDLPVGRRVVLLLNSDEEVGSESSRPITEKEAHASDAVLVLEPATGLEGKLKTARKGVGDYTLTVRGRAAHAGLDFHAGANAILELARQLDRIAGFTNLKRGLTVSPGVVAGGTRSNVVPAEARAEIDVRVLRTRDAVPLDRKMRALRPFDKRCSIEVSGGVNRPPMERSPGTIRLFRLAQELALELGVELEESSSGGGSDGNFTAALGVPTLDGLGAVGEGAHAPHESILVDRIADRTALLAKLVQAI